MARTRSHTRRRPRANPRGVLSTHAGGFGFVRTAEGEFYVPEGKMAGAFDGDLVEVAPLPSQGAPGGKAARERPSARVLRVVDRAHDSLVGRYEVAEPFGVVIPEDARIPYDIFTMRADRPDIEDGSLVRVRITAFPTRHTAATGVVEEVLGRADDERASVEAVIARHKLETAFSDGALEEARAAALDEEGALASGYRDLRDRFTFTIDPADARDFDDAVSLEPVSTWGTTPGFGDAQSLKQSSLRCGTRLVGTPEPGRSKGKAILDASGGEVAGVGGVDGGRSAGEGGSTWEGSAVCHPERSAERGVEGSRAAAAPSGAGAEEAFPPSVCVVGARRLSEARWRLGVHIADVSHYVRWGSSLDLDARRRATSVYLVDRVIPMLPEELSGDLCSLKPGEVRRTMTADLYLDAAGRLVAYDLFPALIRSRARLSYDEAQELLDASASGATEDGLAWRLRELSRLAKARAAAREAAGGLDFGGVEARVRLDGEGRPEGIDLRRKTEATSLVEEAMILANETVAAHLRDARFPSLYRAHERPAADSLAALVPVFQEFAWFRDVDQERFVAGDPHVAQRVLAASAGRPEGELVSSLLLRSMKRAVYRPACEPHYGLASAAYTHFTSPIRRYPDLVVHRMLRAQLFGRPGKFDQEASALPWIAEHSSDMERVAEKAARESQELKMIEYLEGFVGQTFSAVVSGVAAWGLYVRLDNTAEGLVPARRLGGEYFALDPVLHRLVGQDTGASYRLGQRLAVVLEGADPRARRLDFRLARIG